MNLSPDTNINTHYSPVPVNIVTKVEELREDLLKAVPRTDIPEGKLSRINKIKPAIKTH